MCRSVFILLCLWGSLQIARAYPISPRPLRMLVAESKYIIAGYVVKTFEKKEKRTKKDQFPFSVSIARIAVLECIQGKLAQDTIELEFDPHVVCPAPPMYYDSTRVLCFLNEDENGKLYTHARNYGSKTLPPEDIAMYKTRIKEMQEILSHTDKNRQHSETLDWLVTCAAHKTTRWEGSFELRTGSHFMSFYSDGQAETFTDSLNAEQKQRLYKSLQSSDRLDYNDLGLVDLVYKGNEAEIDALLLKNLKTLTAADYWAAEAYMQRLRYRNLTAEMRKTMADFEELRNDLNFYDKKTEIKAIIDRFGHITEK